MARESGVILDNGDLFPDMTFPAVDGGGIRIPRDILGKWSIFLVYRGHW